MAKARQVGGMQETFIQVNAKSIGGLERAVKVIEKAGGRVIHAYPPRVLVAKVPAGEVEGLAGKSGIVLATPDPHDAKVVKAADRELAFAMTAWNDHFNADRRVAAAVGPEIGKSWGVANRQPPDPPAEVQALLRRREQDLLPASARAVVAGAPVMSIPVLVGRIAVGLVYVDSTVTQFQITDNEKSKVLSETIEGLNMLAGFEPRANIQWFYDLKRPKIGLTASQFTSANQNQWEDLWRDAAMQAMGFTNNLAGMNAYIAQIKANNNAAWAYAVFVTKYPKFWFGYEWANHIVMDFGVDGWGIDNFHLVVAHETGHIFGCPDEYASSGCNCTSLFGRYQIANGNCENCASPFVPCLMAHNTAAVCDYTRGHLGWNEVAVLSQGTTTLKGTWTFDLETGAQGPPTGADIWWEQVNNVIRFLVPLDGAQLANMGKPNFDAVSLQTLKTLAYTSQPIDGSNNASNKLTAGTVVAIKTKAGHYAKLKVNSYGYNLGISWVTYS